MGHGTEYTRKDLLATARAATKDVRMATMAPARLVDYSIAGIGTASPYLKVFVRACDGFRQIHVAI